MSTAIDSLTLRVQAEQIANAYLPNGGRPAMVSDPDTVQVFLAALADGNYRETACKLAGISKQTLYNTIQRAEQGDESAIAFVDALEKAEAAAESKMVQAVRRAGELPQYWAAAATHLERKFPERWGRRDEAASVAKVQVTIGAVNITAELTQIRRGDSLSPSVSTDFHRLTPSTDTELVNIMPLIGAEGKAGESQAEPAALAPIVIPAQGFEGVPPGGGGGLLPGRGSAGRKGRAGVKERKKA